MSNLTYLCEVILVFLPSFCFLLFPIFLYIFCFINLRKVTICWQSHIPLPIVKWYEDYWWEVSKSQEYSLSFSQDFVPVAVTAISRENRRYTLELECLVSNSNMANICVDCSAWRGPTSHSEMHRTYAHR